MFKLNYILDRIILKPEELTNKISTEDLLISKIKTKYVGKVLFKYGIVCSLKSLKIINNTIVEIEGVINIEYETQLITFSPSNGDILYGNIINSSEEGILVNCGICKVHIKPHGLFENCEFCSSDSIWSWRLKNDTYYYNINEEVRLKVQSVSYINENKTSEQILSLSKLKENIEISDYMIIYGCFNQSGLGPLRWWN